MAKKNDDRRRRSARDTSSRDASVRPSSNAAGSRRPARAARDQQASSQADGNRRPANSQRLSRESIPDPAPASQRLSRESIPNPSPNLRRASRQPAVAPPTSSHGGTRQPMPAASPNTRGITRQSIPDPAPNSHGITRRSVPDPTANLRGDARQSSSGSAVSSRGNTRQTVPDPYTRWTDPRSAELRRSATRADAQRMAQSPAQQQGSNQNRRSREAQAGLAAQNSSSRTAAKTRNPQIRAIPAGGAQNHQPEQQEEQPQLRSTRVGTLRRAERAERLRKSTRRYVLRIVLIVGIVVALLAGWAALYNSPAFTIEEVKVNGVEHLTSEEMTQLANVPMDSTLLRVDTDVIASRIKKNSWVQDVQINRLFPNTLEINVTERPIKAIVEITSGTGGSVKQWAIAEDHTWLMPIPEQGSEAAKTTSAKIYEDAAAALHIKDVPYGTKAEIGEVCTDNNVNNALDIIAGMTTDLSDRVVEVSAAGPAETTLVLDDGVEIAFGKAEDIRDKERVILKILEENPDGVAYINVRMVETPTWRSL